MEKVCFPKLLLPVPFLTLKFKQVLKIFTKVFKTWTSQGNPQSDSTVLLWAPWREKCICTAPKSHEGRLLQIDSKLPRLWSLSKALGLNLAACRSTWVCLHWLCIVNVELQAHFLSAVSAHGFPFMFVMPC